MIDSLFVGQNCQVSLLGGGENISLEYTLTINYLNINKT